MSIAQKTIYKQHTAEPVYSLRIAADPKALRKNSLFNPQTP